MTDTGVITVLIALLAGAIRVSTPFLFVSLGECLTEKSGRVNLGLEGTLVLGAMVAFAISYHSGSPWLGVAAAAGAGFLMGALHGAICRLPRVNDIAIGIAMMSFGTGLALFLGKPYIQPSAPRLPSLPLGDWLDMPALAQMLDVSPLFLVGLALAFLLDWVFRNTRAGLIVRVTGDDAAAARALGIGVDRVRLFATALGGASAGVGGAFLSLYYPGSWNEGLSSGQGLMAVALVIFARWQPRRCLLASLFFGAASALGPALQSVGITAGYYFLNAAPYVLTLLIMAGSGSARRAAQYAPGELSINR
ncbi:ABC transporter permease [Starkeya sp. 3C]|uniref:ABC transporter permease n=1 Tax=Ancylobacter moscoviensis TaxID=2597768 RepID=A0ABY3DUH1_9HYPH|nr:ABC transporter permease [Ancylobacter moscoviensis]TSJ64092.1 ABC transporter permease [Ancylobacter moscoviensis]